MSKDIISEHIAEVTAGNEVCTDWHKTEVQTLAAVVRELRGDIGREILGDVRPEDLCIGGLAVSKMIHSSWYERQRTLDIGESLEGPSAGIARLEYWATDDMSSVVQVTMERIWRGYLQNYGPDIKRLARQVRGRPGEGGRTRKIAGQIAETDSIAVSMFDVKEGQLIDDDTLLRMRGTSPKQVITVNEGLLIVNKRRIEDEADWLAHSKYGWEYIGKRMSEGGELTQEDIAQLAIDSFAVQAQAKPSKAEIASARSTLLHNRLGELQNMVLGLDWGLMLMRDGRRLRFSRPHHRN